LAALRGKRPAETTGEDNLKTVRLVFAAYDSAASGNALDFQRPKNKSLGLKST